MNKTKTFYVYSRVSVGGYLLFLVGTFQCCSVVKGRLSRAFGSPKGRTGVTKETAGKTIV